MEAVPSIYASRIQVHSLLPICDNGSGPLKYLPDGGQSALCPQRTQETRCRRKGLGLPGSVCSGAGSCRACASPGPGSWRTLVSSTQQ